MLPPRWVVATLALDRAIQKGARGAHVLIEETLAALLDEAERDAVTAHVYARQSSHRPHGANFRAGLFEWEERALAAAAFPPGGRLLLGGAGGGRELRPLLDQGFEVVAFEPSELVRDAQALALERATVVRASYADLVRAVHRGEGPLAPHLRPFDGVILGWGSLMHVTRASSREALLVALRTLAPRAKVIASFWVRADDAPTLRRGIARGLARLGARSTDRVRFAPHAGFYHPFDRAEIEALARASGYTIELYDERGAGHVVLAPGSTLHPLGER